MRAASTLSRPTSRSKITKSQAMMTPNVNSTTPNYNNNLTNINTSEPTVLISNANKHMNHNTNTQYIAPSTKALLESNKDFLFPHRTINISPYEVKEGPFSELNWSNVLSQTCSPSPRGSSTLARQPNPASKKGVSSNSNGVIGIDNFDPNIPVTFTESYTIKAIKRLGIQQTDLFYPTKEEIEKIAGDKNYYKERLIYRANKYLENVRAEREKIIRLEQYELHIDPDIAKQRECASQKRSKSENKPPLCYHANMRKREVTSRAEFEKSKKYNRNIQLPPDEVTYRKSDQRNEKKSNERKNEKLNERTQKRFDGEISERMVSKDKPKVKAPLKQANENRFKTSRSKFTRSSIELDHTIL
ncbi:hypothetical protein TRFO_11393 [Tritrichomonas foetus]|uniref:Uncharacterized protein n=1 Tax=Tritrichomonas foetus TaxID=1144522 RepID=A0A1J4J3T4_9EUKA|nr:hypothetical protein TRFO_11393 [Tritrichomonas foetus]|eukprot:OHS94112.1 hypothetical protein TRFO_11393 [Tritrichomonas foetus]